ncbi:hypothetical protein PM082_022397 [Marasmius tenuissimus]|nr:hypothetical protein PM082_022397 [Marasmius tenuissimus]
MTELLRISIDRVLFIENYHLEQGSPHGLQTICQHLPAIQSNITRLDSEITRLKLTLTLLKNHWERLSCSITKGRSLIPPPVHRLPSKLLSCIFEMASEPFTELSALLQFTCPLWIVEESMVCARWRAITLSTPRLWSAVKFVVLHTTITDIEHLRRMTKRFITRTRTSPLTVKFNLLQDGKITLDPGDPFTLLVNQAVEILCERSFQWLDVEFVVPPNLFLLPTVQSIRGNLPNLRKISVHGPETPLAFTHILLNGGCPALRAIEIYELGELEDELLQTILWQQVEDLKLDNCCSTLTRSPFHLVSLCPKLKSLNLGGDGGDKQNDYHFTGHVTSNMESLTLTLMSDYDEARDTWVAFFDHITLPRLSSLTLQGTYHTYHIEDISSILQCVTQSACPIISLALEFSLLSMTENYCLLSLLPSLTTLALYEHWYEMPFRSPQRDRLGEFSRLLYVDFNSPETPNLLPRLQKVLFDLSNLPGPYRSLRWTVSSPLIDSNRGADWTLYRAVASRWLPDR